MVIAEAVLVTLIAVDGQGPVGAGYAGEQHGDKYREYFTHH